MPTLQMQVLEEELRRAERRLADLESKMDPMPNEMLESEYLNHKPVHTGPEYLEVYVYFWENRLETEHGKVCDLTEARDLASRLGLKGISITFK